MAPKIVYTTPVLAVQDLWAERCFCQSGNIPDKFEEADLFNEDF